MSLVLIDIIMNTRVIVYFKIITVLDNILDVFNVY